MNDFTVIDGIECYELDGTAYLKLETVARGLGFTQNKNGIEYIRWDRIEGYLSDFGFPHKWGKDDFIPENVFYRLAMKAKNPVAEAFQAKVADEIIPAIRKTGSYTVAEVLPERPITRDDYLAAARILAGCRNERLPMVVTMLDKAGLDMEEVMSVRGAAIEARQDTDPKISDYEMAKLQEMLSIYSDAYVADKAGLYRAQINQYRHGQRVPRRSRYEHIMKAMGFKP